MANYLGIEIGPDAVRGALLKTQLRKVQVARYIEVPIVHSVAIDPALAAMGAPDGAPAVAHQAPVDPVQAAIRELLVQLGPPRPSIIAALPGEEASIRRIELPAAAAKKIDELLPFEMEALVPFDAEQTMLDHQPIETAEGKLHVLVVAVPKDRIRQQLDHLTTLGADPQELAVGAAALDALPLVVPALATEGPHFVIHTGPKRTDVCVLRGGRCELARTISAGVADIADVSFAASAASAMAMPGVRFAGTAAERLVRELKQTLASWRMQGGGAPASFQVSGAGGADPRIAAWIGEVLGQPVQLLELPDATPSAQPDPQARARFALALALAARPLIKGKRVDLRKGEFVARRTTGWVRQHAPLLSACAASIVVAFLFSTYAQWSVLDARRALLEDELARVTRERLGEETRSPTRARTLLEGGGSRTDPLPRFTAYDALAAISAAIPADITHDVQRLHVDLGDDRSGGHFELSGVVSSIEDRDRIAQALGQVECFREVELGPLTQAPNERRSYRIEADIQCPGDAPPGGASKRRGGRSRSSSSGGSSARSTGGGE